MIDLEELSCEIEQETYVNRVNPSLIDTKQSSNSLQTHKGHIKAAEENQFKSELQNVYYERRKSKPNLEINLGLLKSAEKPSKKVRKCSWNVTTYETPSPLEEANGLRLTSKCVSGVTTHSQLLAPGEKPVRLPSARKIGDMNYLDVFIRASEKESHEAPNSQGQSKKRSLRKVSKSRSKTRKSKSQLRRGRYGRSAIKTTPETKFQSDRVITMGDISPLE